MSVMYYTYLNDMKLYMDHRPKYLNKIVLYCIVLYCIVLYCKANETSANFMDPLNPFCQPTD